MTGLAQNIPFKNFAAFYKQSKEVIIFFIICLKIYSFFDCIREHPFITF